MRGSILFVLFLFSSQTSATGSKLIIDHDAGSDDAMAIFMALLHEKYFGGPQVIGLTTSHGNVDESQVFINTQKILDLLNRTDVPVYRGCNSSLVYTNPSDFYFGYDGLGDNNIVTYKSFEAQPQHASIALIELSKKYKDDLVILTTGALTNIALAITLDPGFIGRISQLYAAAGTIYSAEYSYPQYNANADVEAYQIVVQNSTPDKVSLISTSQNINTQNTSRKWRECVLGSIPTEIMRAQNIFERYSIKQHDFWYLLDPVAAAILLDNSLIVTTKYSNNSIIMCGDQRGININNFTDASHANVKLIYASVGDQYKQLLLNIFGAELT